MKERFTVKVGETYRDTDRRYRAEGKERTVTVKSILSMPDAHGVIRAYAQVVSNRGALSYIRLDRFAPVHNGLVPVDEYEGYMVGRKKFVMQEVASDALP